MTAVECLEHKWLKEPDVKASSVVQSSPVVGASPVSPCRTPSVSDSPSGQRRALASTLTDDDDSDESSSLREPAKKCRCDVDLKQPPVDQPRPDCGEDKENFADLDVEKRRSTTLPKLDNAESSPRCSGPTTAAVSKTLIGGVCIDVTVA